MTKRRRTDNTMAKREGQTTQWPKEKDRQHNGQKKKDKSRNNDLQTSKEHQHESYLKLRTS
jgi:hypothetical protein